MQVFGRPRRWVSALGVVLALALTSCSGADGADGPGNGGGQSSPTALGKATDVPGVTMIDRQDPWPSYTTAKITEVEAGAGGRTITVNYDGLADQCSGFAGYAVHRTASAAEVTVITGVQKGCTGKDTHRTTVLPLGEPLGTLTPRISRYSRTAIPIG